MAKSKYDFVKVWRKRNKAKVNEQAKRYRAKHPDKIKVIQDRHYQNNIERLRERNKLAKQRERRANPEAQRRRQLAWRERLEDKLAKQAGRPRPSTCEICNSNKFKIVFDHCHSKGVFRGWICDQCNKVLGLVYDNPETLRMMISYLEKHNGKADDKAA